MNGTSYILCGCRKENDIVEVMCDSGLEKLKENSNSYMHPNLYCAIKCEENFIFYNNVVICHSRGLLIPVTMFHWNSFM
jgi:hypothetical protein